MRSSVRALDQQHRPSRYHARLQSPANDEFCPDRAMTRGEMAAMLARAFAVPASDEDYFLDDDGNRFEDVINRSPEQGSRSAAILRERPLLRERTSSPGRRWPHSSRARWASLPTALHPGPIRSSR